jgi:hypothetical protein
MDFQEIACYVHSLGRQYANGLERVELVVCAKFRQVVPKPVPGQRISIRLTTPQGDYEAGLRIYDDQVYVCPDLRQANDRRVKLAEVLLDNGIHPGQTVAVRVADRTWELLS